MYKSLWSVRMGKNYNLRSPGHGQHFKDLCHSFSLYGLPTRSVIYKIYLPENRLVSLERLEGKKFNGLLQAREQSFVF